MAQENSPSFEHSPPVVEQQIKRQLEEVMQNTVNQTNFTMETFEAFHHSGPLPSPESLAEYDKTVPGLAKHIALESAKESEFRRTFQLRALDANIADDRASRQVEASGQKFGFILASLIIISGVIVILAGYPVTGLSLISGTAIGLVSLFVYSRERMVRSPQQLASPNSDARDNELDDSASSKEKLPSAEDGAPQKTADVGADI